MYQERNRQAEGQSDGVPMMACHRAWLLYLGHL